jgi:hypothetical protein
MILYMAIALLSKSRQVFASLAIMVSIHAGPVIAAGAAARAETSLRFVMG